MRSRASIRCGLPIRRQTDGCRRRLAVVGRGSRDPRSRRCRGHGRAARHRCRPVASLPAPERSLRRRRHRPGSGGIAQPHPTIPGRPERHGTELAGIIAGSEGPDGLARHRARRVDPPDPRRRLAAGRGRRVHRLLPNRPDPRRARGGGRSERRRRRARRGAHRADRSRGAVRRVRRTARLRGPSPEREASTRSSSSRPGTTVGRGRGTAASPGPAAPGGAHRRCSRRPSCRADGPRTRSRGAQRALRRRRAARRSALRRR